MMLFYYISVAHRCQKQRSRERESSRRSIDQAEVKACGHAGLASFPPSWNNNRSEQRNEASVTSRGISRSDSTCTVHCEILFYP